MKKNLLISGVGKVGKYIYDLAESLNFSVVCCIDNNRFIKVDCPIYSSFDEVKENVDIIIDFSSNALCMQAVEFALKNKCVFITGTTALSNKTKNRINVLSKSVAVCVATNFSQGMSVVYEIAKYAIEHLSQFDVGLVELHSCLKKDAPSGTAKKIASLLSIKNVHSLRGGDVAGVHTIYLLGKGEEITITHRAYTKEIFAYGALQAAKIICNKSSGLYSIEELFNEK